MWLLVRFTYLDKILELDLSKHIFIVFTMKQLFAGSFSLLSSGHLLIGRLHIISISILIITSSIWKHLFLIIVLIWTVNFVVLSLARLITFRNSFLTSFAYIFLFMVQKVLKPLVKQHFICVTNTFIFIQFLSFQR